MPSPKPPIHIWDHKAQPDPVRRAAWKDGPSSVSVCVECERPVAEHRYR